MRLWLRILRVYRVRYLYVTKQKKKLSGREVGDRPRVSKGKNRKKRTKLKNSNQIIIFRYSFPFRDLSSKRTAFSDSSSRHNFFFQARESSDNENLNAFHGYHHWLWSHCGLDRSRSSMPVKRGESPFYRWSTIVLDSVKKKKKACVHVCI